MWGSLSVGFEAARLRIFTARVLYGQNSLRPIPNVGEGWRGIILLLLRAHRLVRARILAVVREQARKITEEENNKTVENTGKETQT